MKRERDRLSSQLDTVTQECSDARENALSNEQELQDVCNKRLEECSAGYGNLNNELSSCHSALTNANLGMSQCSSQVRYVCACDVCMCTIIPSQLTAFAWPLAG